MASNTDYLPDEITYGFVADRVLLAVGDTTSDDNRYPDGVPAQGTVRFSPERTILYTQETPATVLPQDIECTIYHRDHPVAVNNGYEPELVGKLVDPAGHVGNVALIVGWYEAVYRLETGTAQRFRFKVLPEHTNENPLWLPSVAPLTPTPSERFVVNEQVYNDTKEARDEAVGAAVTAVEARTGAETARDQAGTHATASATSASTAADILAANQALGITVDTSVGTRVYVGNTMIHGDTGWRHLGTSNTDAAISADIHIRRQNAVVELFLEDLMWDGVEPGEHLLLPGLPLPRGFSQKTNGSRPLMAVSDADVLFFDNIIPYIAANSLYMRWVARMGRDSFHTGEVTSTKPLAGSITWTTTDSWPTSLPGSPT